jgi:hypothetical protein
MAVHTLETAKEWQAGVPLAVCFVHACDNLDIDPRGPVFLRDDMTPRYACTPHWEGVFRVLGEQGHMPDAMHWSPDTEETR